MGGVLVLASQPRIASHIRVKDGGELARQTVFHTEVSSIEK
jgi:hypothetical protein